ncbi:MerR family transcriptional regulator [Lysinibacillus endophyticus]|uniref:MerR family transcriptional regulator n=1 Tax=Ureibacillus endophyticus TaxID=1978490 RepID=A0A494Z0Z2_9BACL|nr:MerR family transcriptional regulator [Lysinibacillus endophyticus]MCP1144245.1 MerR family transcriptional regulator [Lysinibacillus endophyticus]RKQ16197.1 MerR family transcriptional regulator [Lysinibacillus endophyticus]
MSREFRRAMPLLPISMVMKLTELSARQIRYYEEHKLIEPAKSEGNRRMFSLNDVDALLEIRDLLNQGINIAGVKKVFDMRSTGGVKTADKVSISDAQLRSILREEIQQAQILEKVSLRNGDLPRIKDEF